MALGGYPHKDSTIGEDVIYKWVEDDVGMTKGKVYLIGPALLTEAIPDSEIGLYCVALKDSADGDKVLVGVKGAFEMYLLTATIAAGQGVSADNSDGLAKSTGTAAAEAPGDQAGDEIGFVITAGSGGSADSIVYLYGLPCVSIS